MGGTTRSHPAKSGAPTAGESASAADATATDTRSTARRIPRTALVDNARSRANLLQWTRTPRRRGSSCARATDTTPSGSEASRAKVFKSSALCPTAARSSNRIWSPRATCFPHAHTRPEFAEGLLRALQDVGGGVDDGARGRGALRHHHSDPSRLREQRIRRDARESQRRQALLLRRGPAGRSTVFPREPPPRLRLRPRAGREGRLLRQRAEVQGASVDDGHLLDEELHRDSRRSPSTHRPRPSTEREDRGPPARRPAAVHLHRRHRRRPRSNADAEAVRPRPRHHGQ